jgi:hypothetical protein
LAPNSIRRLTETHVGNWTRTTHGNLSLAIGFAASLLTAGCGDNESAYLDPAPAVSMFNAQALKNPAGTVLIIYNHDSLAEDAPDRCQPKGDTTPDVIRDLVGKRVGGKLIAVYAFCTPSKVGAFNDKYREGEPKVVKRTKDIEFLLRNIHKSGMPPQNIFLAGQGAGAWAPLLVARRGHVAFNSVIAFAPRFTGPKKGRSDGWTRVLREHEQFITRTPEINGLVFAFQNDPYVMTRDLRFLRSVKGINLVGLPSKAINQVPCNRGKPHLTAFDECFRKTQLQRIIAFMSQRIFAGNL